MSQRKFFKDSYFLRSTKMVLGRFVNHQHNCKTVLVAPFLIFPQLLKEIGPKSRYFWKKILMSQLKLAVFTLIREYVLASFWLEVGWIDFCEFQRKFV
jgi:hypothetical protein